MSWVSDLKPGEAIEIAGNMVQNITGHKIKLRVVGPSPIIKLADRNEQDSPRQRSPSE